uniref:Uncharacterized protein n=1 Tax=Knipowitschia caucasica TaxID=637954 RepID=A0AAV2LBG3_KNICA
MTQARSRGSPWCALLMLMLATRTDQQTPAAALSHVNVWDSFVSLSLWQCTEKRELELRVSSIQEMKKEEVQEEATRGEGCRRKRRVQEEEATRGGCRRKRRVQEKEASGVGGCSKRWRLQEEAAGGRGYRRKLQEEEAAGGGKILQETLN